MDKTKRKKGLLNFFRGFDEAGALITLIILCIVIGSINPVFFTARNIINVLRQFSLIGLIAVGGAFVIITKGIDLSVASFMAFGSIGFAYICSLGVEPALAMLMVLVISGVMGFLNGVFIVKLNLGAFIVTLASGYVVKGIVYLISGGLPIKFDNYMNWLGGYWLNVPISVYIMLIIMVVGYIVLAKTEYGRKLFAVGGNERAAKLSGIKVGTVKYSVYILCGMLAALAGMISCANLNSGDVSTGLGNELNVIAACVIGGVSLDGGKGSVLGVFVGAAILGVIKNGFVLLMIPSAWQTVAIGAILLVACVIDQLRNKGK